MRKFILERIAALKKPRTNAKMKQDVLLKFRYFVEFLQDQRSQGHDIAQEIRQTYVETMSSVCVLLNVCMCAGAREYVFLYGWDTFLCSVSYPLGCLHGDVSSFVQRYFTNFKAYLSNMKKLQVPCWDILPYHTA